MMVAQRNVYILSKYMYAKLQNHIKLNIKRNSVDSCVKRKNNYF